MPGVDQAGTWNRGSSVMLDVLPSPAMNDGVDRLIGESRLGCHRLVRHSCDPLGAYPPHDFLSRDRLSVVLASLGSIRVEAVSVPPNGPPANGHVSHVLGVRAQSKVRRIHARWVIAGMKDVHALGDRAVVNLPRQAMSSDVPAVFLERSIAADSRVASPSPASRTSLNELPEPTRRRRALATDGNRLAGPRTIARRRPTGPLVDSSTAFAGVLKRHGHIIPGLGVRWIDKTEDGRALAVIRQALGQAAA